MARLTNGELIWPVPEEISVDMPLTFFQRWRLVIPCFDQEQANRISKQIAGICGHDKECFVSVADCDGTKSLGEAVIHREMVPTDCFAFVDEQLAEV